MKKIMLMGLLALMSIVNNWASAQQCDTVRLYPWAENIAAHHGCWTQIGDTSALWGLDSTYSAAYDGGVAFGLSAEAGVATEGCVLVSPAIALPDDTVGLQLSFRTRRTGPSTSLHVLVTTGERDSLALYDTVYSKSSFGNDNITVDLSAYAGQTVYIAFSVSKNNVNGSLYRACIGNIAIRSSRMPLLSGSMTIAPAATAVGDTVVWHTNCTAGDSLLTVTWHSTMLDSTITTTGFDCTVVYTTTGVDTVSVVVSNAFGTVYDTGFVGIYTCDTISTFPWIEDFETMGYQAAYDVCWERTGYNHLQAGKKMGFVEEDGSNPTKNDCMRTTTTGSYLLTPPIAVPAVVEKNLSLWVEHQHSLVAVIETDSVADTVYTIDTYSSNMQRRTIPLTPYAGQTIRVRLLSNYSVIDRVRVDYDTLPVVNMAGQAKTTTDSLTLFTASLRRGSAEGLAYSWHSAYGGIISTNAAGDSAWVAYGAGLPGNTDTITVVATNAYGSGTASQTIYIVDCTPAISLPWKETFTDGLQCWYKPDGSQWVDDSYFSYSTQRYLYIGPAADTAGSWIMSKEIQLPADTGWQPSLFWKVASSSIYYQHSYSVLITDSADYTDTANYTLLYLDTARHVSYSNYDILSVSLTAYAGRNVHIALHNTGNQVAASYIGLYIDDIEIRATAVPVLALEAPSQANSLDPNAFVATLTEGTASGLTYTWHSTLMDSTWVTTGSQNSEASIIYPQGGTDTITVVAANAYGTDTARAVVSVADCSPIDSLPWLADFYISGSYNASTPGGKMPGCWHRHWGGTDANSAPHLVTTYEYTISPIYSYLQSHTSALLMIAGGNQIGDSVAMVETPAFSVPLEGKLLSFRYAFENANYGSLIAGYLQDSAFVTLDTVTPQATGKAIVRLMGIPAGVDRIALRWEYESNDYWWWGVIVDSVLVAEPDTLPIVSLSAPATAMVGDTTTLRANLTDGLLDSLTFTWHSTLLDSTWSTGAAYLTDMIYTADGTDTLSVVAANAYGADTVWAVVEVQSYPLPQVTLLNAPALVETGISVPLSATATEGSPNGRVYTWHSSLMDSTWTTSTPNTTLMYTTAGFDTLTLTLSNAYGADSDTAIVEVYSCLKSLPYTEDFEGVEAVSIYEQGQIPLCWTGLYTSSPSWPNTPHLHVVGDLPYESLPSKALYMVAGTYNGYSPSIVAVLPHMDAPLQNIAISFDYRFEYNSSGTLEVGYFDDSTSAFTPIDTVPSHAGSYTTHTTAFASATDTDARIAIRWTDNGWVYYVLVDNIHVFANSGAPQVAITSGPQQAYTGDTALFTGQLLYGDTTGITYTWLSQTGTVTPNTLAAHVVYSAPGVDTITLIATNAYGADTAKRAVTVGWNLGLVPHAAIVADAPFYTCDGGLATATLTAGDSTGLVFAWTSSLTGVTATGATLTLPYTVGGTDTLTLVATNAYGADTVSLTVEVRQCEALHVDSIVVSDPAASDEELRCWKVWQFDSIKATISDPHGRWRRSYDYHNDSRPAMVSNDMNMNDYGSGILMYLDDWLVSPLIELPQVVPGDVYSGITLGWNARSEYTTYYVLLSTTGRHSPADFTDTVATVVKDYNTFGPWEPYSVDLTAYAGQTVSVAFVHRGPIPTYELGKVYMDSLQVSFGQQPRQEHTVTLHRTHAAGDDLPAGCAVSGAGTYLTGDTATIEALSADGYAFAYWIGPWVNTTENPHSFVVVDDVEYTAVYVTVADTGNVTPVDPVDSVGVRVAELLRAVVYPNPATSEVSVECTEVSTVSLLDVSGREVYRSATPAARHRIDIASMPAGTYFVRIGSASGVATEKLIIRGR